MFSSAPPSPEYKPAEHDVELIRARGSSSSSNNNYDDPQQALHRQRSVSLTPMDSTIVQPVSVSSRPNLIKNNKSTFSTILSKATKKKSKHRRKESTITQDSQSTYFDDTTSSLRRSSDRSDATTISEKDLMQPNQKLHQLSPQRAQSPTKPLQLLECDEEEADRIQLKNDLVKLAFEGEFSLPFDYRDLPSGRILDVGCGPGSWCIDLSTKYPRIQVIGVDSDDMFPSKRNLPSNCQLLVCNVLDGLKEFPEGSFDVIHIRFMVLSFTTIQYPQVVKDCWRLLKPGGYIEILETDLTVHSPGPITMKLNEEMHEVSISRGLNPRRQADKLSELVPSGAINRQVKYRSIPIGVWGGRIGVLCRDDMINMLTKFQPAVQDYYKRENNSEAKLTFNRSINTVLREMDQYKSFSNYYFYTAQKPFERSPPSSTAPSISSARRQHIAPSFSFKS
ncbi:type 11 methyltransferase [Mucor ambiguus]|uniref:Type 11 methyltransferase n=1 Tax=Mucor ambiguus TaxID=91626 RepID=A0A0C9MD64_9FUNG|nr:type 11 methyltransferase [Mucor ambiguus]